MGWFDFLFESDVESESFSTLSGPQQMLMGEVSEFLKPFIGKGAEPYAGKLTADIPKLFTEAYQKYETAMGGDVGAAIAAATRDLIAGKPAYIFDPEVTAKRWEETYAGPVMEAWREHVLPGIKEGFNIPGVAYSRGRGRGVGRAASGFYGEYVAPTLYSSLEAGEARGVESAEAAAKRQMEATSMPFQQFVQTAGVSGTFQQLLQQQLNAQYQEFLRTRAEPGWAVNTAMQFMTQPTVDTAAFREPSMIEQIAMLAAGVGGAVSAVSG